ncbi:MAG: hypothetical protein Kow0045_06470 [Albidovulum sp.]
MVALDELGRIRLSRSFFMREFLHSEVANLHGIPNILAPRGCLTRPGMANHDGDHSACYPGFPELARTPGRGQVAGL